ncbi:MPPV-089 CC chemokine-like protein [Magpiepox virus 2]|nr:MPPV-089 CC chemokine-like protein [Magpiepox virus 2]
MLFTLVHFTNTNALLYRMEKTLVTCMRLHYKYLTLLVKI